MALKLDELGKLLDLLREKGVESFEHDEVGVVKIKLGAVPSAPFETLSVALDPIKRAASKLQPPVKALRGRDGLTAEEQEDLYGTQLDEFPSLSEKTE